MFTCDCGTDFELTEQLKNRQKLVHMLRRFRCEECLKKLTRHRHHEALMAFQKKQSELRKKVRRVVSQM